MRPKGAIRKTIALLTALVFMLSLTVAVNAPSAEAGGLGVTLTTPDNKSIEATGDYVLKQVIGAVDPERVYFCWDFSNGLTNKLNRSLQQIQLTNLDTGEVVELDTGQGIALEDEEGIAEAGDFRYTKQGSKADDSVPKLRRVELILKSTNLERDTNYIIELGPEIEANNGCTLGKTYGWKFFTGDADTIAPQWGSGSELNFSRITPTTITVEWPEAQDEYGVTGYRLFLDGELYKTLDGDSNTYTFTNLIVDREYTFKVEAGDAAGNWSTDGPEAVIKTAQDATPPSWSEGSELLCSRITPTSVALTWPAAEDEYGVMGYRLFTYKGDQLIDTIDIELTAKYSAGGGGGGGGGGAVCPASPATNYTVTGLDPGAEYTFKIEAVDEAGNWSKGGLRISIVMAAQDIEAPSWPEGSSLAASDIAQDCLTLNWSAARDNFGVTGYRIYQNGNLIKEIDAGVLTHTVTGLDPEGSYTFKVEAGDVAGNWSTDGPSLSVGTTVKDTEAPKFGERWPERTWTLSYKTKVTGFEVSINWSAATDNIGVTGYRIYQTSIVNKEGVQELDEPVLVETVDQYARSYNYKLPIDAKTYTYRVEAIDAAGNESTNGFDYTVKTFDPDDIDRIAPYWPDAMLTASNISDTSVTISWSEAKDDQDFAWLYAVMKDGVVIEVQDDTVVTFEYEFKNLKPDTEYTFEVQACDSNRNWSTDGPVLTVRTAKTGQKVSPTVGAGIPFRLNSHDALNKSINNQREVYNRVVDSLDRSQVNFSWEFDRVLNQTSVYQNLSLYKKENGQEIDLGASSIKTTSVETGSSLTLDLAQTGIVLEPSAVYVVKLGRNIKDNTGNTLGQDYLWEFNTGDGESPYWQGNILLKANQVKAGSLELQWPDAGDNVGVTSFRIYQNNEELVVIDDGLARTHKVTGLEPGESYIFKVEAGDAAGNWSKPLTLDIIMHAVDNFAPEWPADSELSASDVSADSLTLTWTPAEDDIAVAGYKILRDGQPIKEAAADVLTCDIVEGLTANQTYCFKVEAGDAAGNWSTNGPELSVTTKDWSPSLGAGFDFRLFNPPSKHDSATEDAVKNTIETAFHPNKVYFCWYFSKDLKDNWFDNITLKKVGNESTEDVDLEVSKFRYRTIEEFTGGLSCLELSTTLEQGASYVIELGADFAAEDETKLGKSYSWEFKTQAVDYQVDTAIGVSAGWHHNLALQSDGTVWTWGQGINLPARLDNFDRVAAVSGGRTHSLALRNDGTVWAWGGNEYGQLGNGGNSRQGDPIQVEGLTEIKAVAAGAFHSLALTNEGEVWAWGWNRWGQLGDGTLKDHKTPVRIQGLKDVKAIAAGRFHSLAVTGDGSVWTWGINEFGQLGTGNVANSNVPVKANVSNIKAVATQGDFCAALDNNGGVWTWGLNRFGQLGRTDNPLVPGKVEDIENVAAVATGMQHTVALKQNGTVWAWGCNYNGRLGDGTNEQSFVPVQVKDAAGTPFNCAGIDAGEYHTLAFQEDGAVWAWGWNLNGSLGVESPEESYYPVRSRVAFTHPGAPMWPEGWELKVLLYGKDSVTIEWTRALDQDQDKIMVNAYRIYCNNKHVGTVYRDSNSYIIRGLKAGEKYTIKVEAGNTAGELTSDGPEITIIMPDWNPLDGSQPVSAGKNHTLFIDQDGQVWAWGQNTFGQLGNGSTNDSTTVVSVKGLQNITAVAAGCDHSLALDQDGKVWAWGRNNKGQLGIGSTDDSNIPVQINGPDRVIAIAAGKEHSLALDNNGKVWAWGSDGYRQLGQGSDRQKDSKVPVQVVNLSGIVAIAADDYYSAALKDDGTVWDWGLVHPGNFTNPNWTFVPGQVPGVIGACAIAVGPNHGAALREDGTVWAWGDNGYGQLGTNDYIKETSLNRGIANQVDGLTQVKAVAVGNFYGVALKGDGSVWAWGHNKYGQLGDGTTYNRLTPVEVLGLSEAASISAGGYHTLGIKEDGSLWAWGCNENGQLGDGTTTSRYFPVLSAQGTGIIPSPEWPENSKIEVFDVEKHNVKLNWNPAQAGNTEIAAYKVYQNGKLICIVHGTANSCSIAGLMSGGEYTFKVEAANAVGQWTEDGPSATVTTKTENLTEPKQEITSRNVKVDANQKNLAITTSTPGAVAVTVPKAVQDAVIDVTAMLQESGNTATTRLLPELYIEAEIDDGKMIELLIPEDTVISAQAGSWPGIVNLPTKRDTSVVVKTDPGKKAVISRVIEVGFGSVELTLTKPVRLVLPGDAGKEVGFIRNGEFHKISTVLDKTTVNEINEELKEKGVREGKQIDGNDLIIWTKHFTEFVTFEQITQDESKDKDGSTGGGGGGGGPTAPREITRTIGKDGGSLSGYDATVTIPAQALDNEIEVKIEKVSSTSSLPMDANVKLVSNVVEITRDKAAEFKKPATITLSFNKFKLNTKHDEPGIYRLDETTKKWIELDNVKVDMADGKVSGETTEFSKFAVLAAEKDAVGKEEPKQEEPGKAVSLTDIKGHWAEKTIEGLVASGAVSGYPDGTFKPNQTITRAEFATIMVKAFTLESKMGKVFNDTAGHWAKDSIATAQAYGIVNGYSDTTFGPNDNITREQMAVMIVKAARLADAEGKVFNDHSKISDWAVQGVATSSGNNIITGYPDNTFRPQANATRAEAATVIVKALQ
ncbi:MAG: fibronectin type III domain-containing protein [Syntrophothermaceae bacterium]